jgi:hypothetical protein
MSNSSVPSLLSVYDQLTSFAKLENFWSLFDTVFGSNYDYILAARLRSQWQSGNFSHLPTIEVISDEILGNARGAYASSTNVIYLAASLVEVASPQVLGAVILEEIGHFVDAKVNQADTPGDEGELFSALVRGVSLSVVELSRIKTEDDHAVVMIDVQETAIEKSTVTVQVLGKSNPWLAGMPNGSTAAYGDSAPNQSPVIVSGLSLVSGSVLTFTVTGSVSYYSSYSGWTPDGGVLFSHDLSEENGIGQITAPISSLVAIFLDNNQSNLTPTNNNSLNFSNSGNVANGINYTTLFPQLKQVFFIGDGLNNQGIRQSIVVPNGATRLFLGTMDGGEWNNNVGSFNVNINSNGSKITFEDSTYYLTTATSWTDAEAQAVAMGGHLVTVNDATENQFLMNTFGGKEYLWIGYTDASVEGQWKWTSGETSTYVNWATGEPSNYTGIDSTGEDYSFLNFNSPGQWNDTNNSAYNKPYRGIVEVKNNTATG